MSEQNVSGAVEHPDLPVVESPPLTIESTPVVLWADPEPTPYRGYAGWALLFSIAGLLFSLFVGWGFPIGITGATIAIVALRRPLESRGVAIWALVLGILSLVYSAGWLWWAASTGDLF